ncbi:glutamate synthase-related protein [Neomoorella thermoacetica]|uniref:glutamate synthase (NADPH) n=1 Tax=Neomoorella thermoacetica TaxID=1525 RepID=A0A1J5JKD6_NEOTH|nr:glutamate synthase-related protein [Moorella thermoacetica]OIQ09236.1 glutamate synthase [NADPH] large chain precursor [Moorella thermoacetica]
MPTLSLMPPEFSVVRDENKCIKCLACVRQCGFDAQKYDAEDDRLYTIDANCVNCQRCVSICPAGALTIYKNPPPMRPNAYWSEGHLRNIIKQAETGGVLLTGMGNDQPYPSYFDRLLLNASQVTNPSIDPLREPMELRTYLGSRTEPVSLEERQDKTRTPLVPLETPIMFSAMSYGSISHEAFESLARAAKEFGTMFNTGEGGLPEDLYPYADHAVVQVASGRFGVHADYLNAGRIIEIKIGQGAKPGIGGHLPGEKITAAVSATRMIPEGTDALSPAPHHDIYSIEDLKQLVFTLKEATRYQKPVSVKVSAVHNVAAIASGIARAGADIITVDGFRGGTGAAPTMIRDHVGIPIELAIAAVDQRLREEGIRNKVSLVAAGGFRSSADVVKAIALGADAVYIATAALIALGCHLCQKCYTGKCSWGIATQDPYKTRRLNPEIGAERLYNLLRGWSHEIKEMLGGMGINSIESLRGNRLHLRGVGLNEVELKLLGVKHAGEAI